MECGSFLMETSSSNGRIFTYSAISDTFGPGVNVGTSLSNAGGAVNRDGSLVALRTPGSPASLNTAPDFNFVHSFNGIDGGVAFDALSDTFYGVNSTTDQIIAYSTQTFAELFRLNIGEDMSTGSTPFGTGTLVASADGHWLALETPLGIRLFQLSPPAPTPTPTATPTPTSTPTPPPPPPTSTATPTATPTAIRRHALCHSNRSAHGYSDRPTTATPTATPT